jgi:SNF2 family DNA or RNA helicase
VKPLILRPIQEPMVAWAREHKRCAIWAGMGSGKTSSLEYTIALLKLLGDVGDEPWLVLAPMRVARDTWPEDMARWEQFRDLRIMPLTGTPSERKDKLKSKADIYTVSYELAPWLVEYFMEKWPFRHVIADESDRLKSFREKKGGVNIESKRTSRTGKRAHSLGLIAHNLTERWINLTGTPSPNGLKDLWGQTWYIDRGVRLGRTYSAFTHRWFKPKWNGHGIEPMPHSDKEIHDALKDICVTIDPHDYYDLAQPIVTPIIVKLPPKARAIYKKLERELFAELGELGNIEAFNAAALTNKCLQLANGAVYTEYPKWAAIHDEKIEAVRSIVSEAGGTPILLAYQFKSDIARLRAAFPGAVELSDPVGMKAFRAGDSPMGLAHPKSLGHGIDGLQNVSNILVRYGHDWNLGERMQMLERIGPMRQLQAGLDRAVYVYDIVAEDTVDEDVIAAHIAKRSVQDALLAAMNRRK